MMRTGVSEGRISGLEAGRTIPFCPSLYGREAPPGPSAALFHLLIAHAPCSDSNNSQELFLRCSLVSPPSFTYCQQPSWALEDVLAFEAQSSTTTVTSDTWDLALQPAFQVLGCALLPTSEARPELMQEEGKT